MKQEKWYVGQKVWDEALKPGVEGKVMSTTWSESYPVRVNFKDGCHILYMQDGSFDENLSPTLKPYPHRIEIHRIEPEFEKGQIVLVRDLDTEYWKAARFIEIEEGLFVCNNWKDGSSGDQWEQCIPFEGNEHILLTAETP